MKINTISVSAKPICTLLINVKALVRVFSTTRREPMILLSHLVLVLWVENQVRVGKISAADGELLVEIAEIQAKERPVSPNQPLTRAAGGLAARRWPARPPQSRPWLPLQPRSFADGPSMQAHPIGGHRGTR